MLNMNLLKGDNQAASQLSFWGGPGSGGSLPSPHTPLPTL
jgi:hypothetical protein